MKGSFIFYICGIGNNPTDCQLIIRKVFPVSIPRLMSRNEALKYCMPQFRHFFSEMLCDKHVYGEFDKHGCTFLLEDEMLFTSFISSYEDGFEANQKILVKPTRVLRAFLISQSFQRKFLFGDCDEGHIYSDIIDYQGMIGLRSSYFIDYDYVHSEEKLDKYERKLKGFGIDSEFQEFDYYFPHYNCCLGSRTIKLTPTPIIQNALQRENVPYGYPATVMLRKLKHNSQLWRCLNHDLLNMLAKKLNDVRSKRYEVNKMHNPYLTSFVYPIDKTQDFQTISWINPEAEEAVLKLEITRTDDRTKQNYSVVLYIRTSYKFSDYHLKVQCYNPDDGNCYCNRTYDDSNDSPYSHVKFGLLLNKDENHVIEIYYNV